MFEVGVVVVDVVNLVNLLSFVALPTRYESDVLMCNQKYTYYILLHRERHIYIYTYK